MTFQVWGTTAQVLTLGRKALLDLTPPQPSLARSRGVFLTPVCHSGLDQLPLHLDLLGSPCQEHSSEIHLAQAFPAFRPPLTRAFLGFLTPTPYPLLSNPLEPTAPSTTHP